MREVTKEEFYKVVGDLDVTVTPKGDFPYRTNFALRNGRLVGYAQDADDFEKSSYYLI